ncbi:MAG: hypothetical protein ACTHOR_00390 [Devosia sp.]|jgi:hypothetical protein
MTKIHIAAVLGLVLATGAAAPALAASVASCRGDTITLRDGRRVETINYFADIIEAQLKARGYDVSNVESWGGCIKAFLTEPNGRSHIAFFDPETLEPLSY